MSDYKDIPGIQLLRFNHAGAMQLKDGTTLNYGVIRVTNNEVVYFTGKGLREMWKPSMTEEEKIVARKLKQINESPDGESQLILSGHIAVTPFDHIERVMF